MSDRIKIFSRRKLLKTLAASSGAIVAGKSLPDKWTRPIVESVMMPAHAGMSPQDPTLFADCSPADDSTVSNPATVTQMDLSASAPYPASVVAQRICNGSPVVTFSPIDLNSGDVEIFTISANSACGTPSSGDTFGLRATRQDDNFVVECTWTYLAL